MYETGISTTPGDRRATLRIDRPTVLVGEKERMTEREYVYVIAEAGVNHNGDLDKGLALVDAAAEAGADAVKFQTFQASQLAAEEAAMSDYQRRALGEETESQRSMLQKLELDQQAHWALKERAQSLGIDFVSTAFDIDSLHFLADLGVPWLKVSSGELTNGPLLLEHAHKPHPLVVSTGMATLAEIEEALGVLAYGMTRKGRPSGTEDLARALSSAEGQAALKERVTLLHCTSQYPAPPEHINLRAMQTLASTFGLPVGYSDHSAGEFVPSAAVALGASVVEKHFTLDRNLPGPDHQASLEPDELRRMVEGIRTIEQALGNRRKHPQESEWETRAVARQVVVARRAIRQGETIESEALSTQRAGEGLSPMRVWELIGRPATRDYAKGEVIQP